MSRHTVALAFTEAATSQIATEGIATAIATKLQGFGGRLVCRKCDKVKPLGKVADRLLNGWPVCCGETMVWHTNRQVGQGRAADASDTD